MTRKATLTNLQKHSFLTMLSVLFVVTFFTYYVLLSALTMADEALPKPELILPIKQAEIVRELTAKTQEVTNIIQSQKKIRQSFDEQAKDPIAKQTNADSDIVVSPPKKTEVATAKTENYDSSSSIELIPQNNKNRVHIWDFSADVRGVYASYEKQLNNGEIVEDTDLLMRLRLDGIATISDNLRAGFGIAGTCAISNCDVDFTLQTDLPGSTGLNKGQITIDEMYLHWLSDEPHRFKIAIGRMQTRSVLKTGVFNKSLDRINSNNARINWTDGIHTAYQFDNGWTSNFIMQYNSKEGSGNVYHDAIDFGNSDSRKSYFASFDNNQEISGVTQSSLGISYLPSALLSSEGVTIDETQEHDDYLGLVGKIAWVWPQQNNRSTLRGGFEFGYSPTLPNHNVVGIVDEEAVSGLAWNVVFNIMDFYPGQNVGINYAHTGAGWQLSPQYTPNTKLVEFRYQWQIKSGALFEARLRWQEELEESKVIAKNPLQDNQVDFYLRFTRNF
jgi:hypothetical protein